MRLEQGRDQHPSVEVLDALARALQLDEDATMHLHWLARPSPTRRSTEEREQAPASIEQLLASWPTTPAFVMGRHLDVLAANRLACALSPAFAPGVNTVLALFLDPEMRHLFRDWEGLARNTVALLHSLVGPDVDDPRLGDLVAELSTKSEPFRQLWARHDLRVGVIPVRTLDHPLVGPMELWHERLAIVATDRQLLIVWHAELGSPSERALSRLAELAADRDRQRSFKPSG